MDYQTLKINEKFEGQVCEIRLSTPPANILNAQMMADLSRQLDKIAARPHLKLVVIAGEGAHFSYGASVEEHLPEKVNNMLPDFHRLIGKVVDYPVPTLATVSGLCLGGGFELALACSLLMADETAKFAVPEIQLGVFPPVAAALLPLQGSPALCTRMILTGERLGAKDLLNAGLIHSLAPTGELDTIVVAFIEKHILPKSASSLRFAHRAARSMISEQYRKTIGALEKLYLNELMSTKDAVEGIRSFVEKRPPQWTNV